MFSLRTAWDRSANDLAREIDALRAAGASFVDLTESNPTRVGLHYPTALLDALTSPQALTYEPDPRGLPSARKALIRYLADRGVETRADRVFLTASTSEAYAFLFKLLCDPGDELLVQPPSYPLFDYLAGLESVRVVSEDSARVRAALIVNPNNPTGTFIHQGELEALASACAETNRALISDEVFNEYGVGGDDGRVTDVAGARLPCLTFSLGGLSKSACLPQLKLSWIIVSGPDALAGEAVSRLELIADTYLSTSTPVQLALPKLLQLAPVLREQLVERIAQNRLALLAARPHGAPWSVLPSQGGWYAVLRVPLEPSEQERCVRLARAGVLVQPGFFYDFPSGAHVVISLISPATEFARALPALVDNLS